MVIEQIWNWKSLELGELSRVNFLEVTQARRALVP